MEGRYCSIALVLIAFILVDVDLTVMIIYNEIGNNLELSVRGNLGLVGVDL